MVGVAEVSRFLVDRRDRPREVRQIARVARCPARPAMRPFARLTVVAVLLTLYGAFSVKRVFSGSFSSSGSV
jgi:hypothetical protein